MTYTAAALQNLLGAREEEQGEEAGVTRVPVALKVSSSHWGWLTVIHDVLVHSEACLMIRVAMKITVKVRLQM